MRHLLRPVHRTVGALVFGLIALPAWSQVDECRVTAYKLAWNDEAGNGEVQMEAQCRLSFRKEVVIVRTLADLNAWSQFLRQNSVQIRVLSPVKREFLGVPK